MFAGLTEETYRFFWDVAFHNDIGWFEENRDRYKAAVQRPLQALAAELAPTVRSIDERLNVRPAAVVSRIRRDTRYTKDKSPYRDHAWLGYKLPGSYVSESFVLYCEFERDHYGYGMGMYAPEPTMMAAIRERILARPQKFLSLVGEPSFAGAFAMEGEPYRRKKFTDVPEALSPYLNMRSLSFCFRSDRLENTLKPELLEEIRTAFTMMAPVYRFLMGLTDA